MSQAKFEKFNACDVRTKQGRKDLDDIVYRAMTDKFEALRDITHWASGQFHPDAAVRRLVSAALRRGLRDGWAEAEGKSAWTRYRAKRSAIEEARKS